MAAVDQLFYPARNQASTRRVGELRFIKPVGSEEIALWSLSPEEGFTRFYGLVLLGPCLAGHTRVRTGRVVIAEANLQKQMHGGGLVGAVG